ncbi:hypothetical protein AVEN_42148-1 [Araneus ventricosus]|uniref:Uncharacterized protein n=1 Tax=Araneus ventricosus TaxID=182803 RepID=A0A4Y2D4N1_ARAVE|nr:hypothetical protein AVEN_42148-1 [Araneus ventricosus]
MEDKETDNDENSKNGDVSDAEEYVLSLQKSLTQLEEKSGKMSGINMEEYLNPASHFTDKLVILEREKEKAIKIYGNQPNGLWWLEFRLD